MSAITLTNTQIRAAADLAEKRKRFRKTLFIVGLLGFVASIFLWFVTSGINESGIDSKGDRPLWSELGKKEKERAWAPPAKIDKTFVTPPHIFGDKIFLASADGVLSTFSLKNGRLLATKRLKNHFGPTSSYSFSGNRLFQQTDTYVDGMVVTKFLAHELPLGKLSWQQLAKPTLSAYPKVSPPPVVLGERVVFYRFNGFFHTYAKADGKLKWICPADEPTFFDKAGHHLATHLYRGPSSISYLTNEEERPQLTPSRGIFQRYKWQPDFAVLHVLRESGIHTTRKHIEGTVRYLACKDGVAALVMANGKLKTIVLASGETGWRKEGKFEGPIVALGRLFVCLADGHLVGFEITTGKLKWRLARDKIRIKGSLSFDYGAAHGNTLFWAGRSEQNTFLLAIDSVTGSVKWSLQGKGIINQGPLIHENITIFAATDGRLCAVDKETGQVRWRSKRD